MRFEPTGPIIEGNRQLISEGKAKAISNNADVDAFIKFSIENTHKDVSRLKENGNRNCSKNQNKQSCFPWHTDV